MSGHTIVWRAGEQLLSVPGDATSGDYPEQLVIQLAQLLTLFQQPGRYHLRLHNCNGTRRSELSGIEPGPAIVNEHVVRIFFHHDTGRPTYWLEAPNGVSIQTLAGWLAQTCQVKRDESGRLTNLPVLSAGNLRPLVIKMMPVDDVPDATAEESPQSESDDVEPVDQTVLHAELTDWQTKRKKLEAQRLQIEAEIASVDEIIETLQAKCAASAA